MIKTKAYQARGVQTWAKTVLLAQLVEPKSKVLDIFCGRGVDIGKWHRADIASYDTVDPNLEDLRMARKGWEEKKKPFAANFHHCNPTEIKIGENGELKENYYDVVSSFLKIESCFATEELAKKLMHNVSKCIKNGGYFFGFMMDSSTVWYKAQKALVESKNQDDNEIVIENDMYQLVVHSSSFSKFGTQVTLSVTGEDEKNVQCLIHFPSFIRIAKEFGFDVICITNLKEFFEDNMRLYSDMLIAYSVFKKKKGHKYDMKIQPSQMDLISLFCVFILQKRNNDEYNW